MTVAELIEKLKVMPQDLPVKLWDESCIEWSDPAPVLCEAGDYLEEEFVWIR